MQIGTGLLLMATATSPSYAGFQVSLGNTNDLAIQTFGAGALSYKSFALGFDPSEDYHTYTVVYSKTFAFFVDGVLLIETSGATTFPLRIPTCNIVYVDNTMKKLF